MSVFVVKHHGSISRMCATREVAVDYIKRITLDILEIEATHLDFVNFVTNLENYNKSGSWSIEEWEVVE